MKTLVLSILVFTMACISNAQDYVGSFEFDGYEREYEVYLPQDYQANMPLVVSLHGSTETVSWYKTYTVMHEVTDTMGFVIVYPRGINKDWNTGVIEPGWDYPDTDDVGFISALIDTMKTKWDIDLSRVYCCGFSLGGMMSYRMAGELGHRLAAIASVSGSLFGLADTWKPIRPMPVLYMQGTKDILVPYDGKGDYWSAQNTINYWLEKNMCTAQADTFTFPDIVPNDGCTIQKISYTSCSGESEVIHYKGINMGHSWPSSQTTFGTEGNKNLDINANFEILNFFKNHKLDTSAQYVNIPDPEFLNALIDEGVDTNGDSLISYTEAGVVTSLDVGEKGIFDMTGIEAFVNLQYLDCSENELTSLDVSNNTALESLSCGWNGLTSLDVSNNTALTELNCGGNQLTSLDVSNNTALESLSCGWNGLTSLDVSNNTALTTLYCRGNQLTSLDVSNNTALTFLSCDDNQLTSLDVSNNTALTSLSCGFNQLTSLDVSNNTALTKLYCGYNQLTSLDVSNNTALTSLWCGGNQLTSLDVSNNTALTYLWCAGNQLTSLDVSNNTALTYLRCGDNQLTSLDVSNNTALTELYCGYNQLTSLDVSNNTALEYLSCGNNQLTILDVSNNTALTELYCGYNQLTSLDVSNNTALESLSCGWNGLTSLDVSNNTALTYLWCAGNQLTSLDVSDNPVLETLQCGNNELNTLDVSKNLMLSSLWIEYMPSLHEVCVWAIPFPPGNVDVGKTGSLNVYFTTDCSVSTSIAYDEVNILDIYPNPSDGIIHIENANNAKVEIYDINGKLIFTKSHYCDLEKIDISDFAKGIYIVKVIQDNNLKVGKLVVK